MGVGPYPCASSSPFQTCHHFTLLFKKHICPSPWIKMSSLPQLTLQHPLLLFRHKVDQLKELHHLHKFKNKNKMFWLKTFSETILYFLICFQIIFNISYFFFLKRPILKAGLALIMGMRSQLIKKYWGQ